MDYSKPIRIGIDGSVFKGKRTGIGRYAYELCRELDECLPNALFFVYSREEVELPIISERWVLRVDPHPLRKYVKMWLKFRCGYLCKSDNLDVFWGANTFLPKLPREIRTVLTVYDMNYKIVPETMTTAALWQFRLFFKKDIERADQILTISEGTSKRLCELMGYSANAIIRPAVDKTFRPQKDKDIRNCLGSYGINTPYILAVATWEPRKNLELLVMTFLNMKNKGLLPEHKLVLVGGKGWKDERLTDLVSGSASSHVLPLGYIPDEDLPFLYAGADVFAFPSVYEGFGMPVLEARACGTRVVTSDIPELREAGGTTSVYISPSAEGIRNGLLEAISDTSKGQLRETDFTTWKSGAKILATALTEK